MTFEEAIAANREYAANALLMAQTVYGWTRDAYLVYYGMAEVVPWPPSTTGRRLRGNDSEPTRPEGTRLVIQNGFAFLVRDKEI